MKLVQAGISSADSKRLADKAFLQSVVVSILGILFCVVSLCSATWAWFQADVSSSSNHMKTGSFFLEISAANGQGDTHRTVTDADNSADLIFSAAGAYTVILFVDESTTVSKGFCIVKINGKEYKTKAVSKGAEGFSFTVNTDEADTTVSFTAVWGSPAPSDNMIEQNGVIEG